MSLYHCQVPGKLRLVRQLSLMKCVGRQGLGRPGRPYKLVHCVSAGARRQAAVRVYPLAAPTWQPDENDAATGWLKVALPAGVYATEFLAALGVAVPEGRIELARSHPMPFGSACSFSYNSNLLIFGTENEPQSHGADTEKSRRAAGSRITVMNATEN